MLAGQRWKHAGKQRFVQKTRKRDRPRPVAPRRKRGGDMDKILVVDIGGTHVKLLMEAANPRQFDSGPAMSPGAFVTELKRTTRDWEFDQISVGFPSVVRDNKVMKEPKHLGPGWIGFDFSDSLGKPAKVINDAAMQALGSYHGGRMLFLGLGTGLGSALVLDGMLFPLELGD